jgi:hypothetical protein
VEVYYVSTGQVQKQAYFKFTDDFNSIDGSFAFNNVPPGTYLLAADGAAPVRVTVSNADVEGVLLTRGPPTFVPLTIVVEEGASSTSAGLDGAIMLQGFIEGIGTPSKQSDITAEAEDGGPLRFEVLNTTYRLAFSQPLPAGLYVKEATFRGQDALREVLRFSDTSAGELRVVFGSHPGRIEGSIVDDGQHPAAGRTVALIPRDHRERPDLVRSVATDDAGRFVFRDVAPGDYRLIAWEEIEPYSWFDPDDIADSAADAIAIQIKESSNEKINLRFERAPGEQRARMRAVRDLPMEN